MDFNDISVQVALNDAKYLRGLEQMERKTQSVGKQIDRAFKWTTGGFLGNKLFGVLSDAVKVAAKDNEEYAATLELIRDRWEEIQEVAGGAILQAPGAIESGLQSLLRRFPMLSQVPGMGIVAGRMADGVGPEGMAAYVAAREAERASKREMDALIAKEKLIKGQNAAARDNLSLMEMEVDKQQELLHAREQDRDVINEVYRVRAERRRFVAGFADPNRPEARGLISQFDKVSQMQVAAARSKAAEKEAEAHDKQRDTARLAEERYRFDLAGLEVAEMRARGDAQAADAAQAMLDAEEKIAEIRKRDGLTMLERMDLIARTRDAADAQVLGISRRGGGSGRGPDALVGIGTAGRGSVLAQTFGGGGGEKTGRDLVGLQQAANKALEAIKGDISAIRREGGGAAFR